LAFFAFCAFVIAGLICISPGGIAFGASIALIKSEAVGAALPLLFAGVGAFFMGMLVALLWFIIRVAVAPQVLAVEDVTGWGAFRRAGVLSSGRIGPGFDGWVKVRLTVLITVVGVILFILSGVANAPALIIQQVYGNVFDPMRATPGSLPQHFLVPAELIGTVLSALVQPIFTVVQTLFYVDMRVRREGLDLQLKLASTPT
jgi:hypothetical protein